MEIASFFMRIIPMVFKLMMATYLWVPFLGMGFGSMIMSSAGEEQSIFASLLGVLIMFGSIGLWFALIVQRLIRMITKNPEYSLFKRKNGDKKSKSVLNPSADKKLVSNTPEGGYPVGKQKGQWIKLSDEESYHAFIVGGTGSGKSSTQVIPLLLSSKLPSFCVDIKGELAEKTCFASSDGLIFNPMLEDSCGYDPFEQVQLETCITDITTIANGIIPASPGSKDDFWISEAQNYLAGCLLFCYLDRMDFVEAMRTIQKTNAQVMIEAALSSGNEDVEVLLGHFNGMAEDTLSGIMANVSAKIMVFASDPDLMRVLSRNRMAGKTMISPSMLIGSNPRSIYIQIPEARLEVYRNFTQLMIGQFSKYFEKQPDSPGHKPRVNFILDEFFRLGKLSTIQSGLATLRSKGVRIHVITQSLAQLEVIYDKAGARALVDNFGVKVLLGATEPESQKYFSDLLGTYDKTMRSRSSNQNMTQFGGSTGVTISEQEKRLIKPEELGRLGNECILFTAGGWTRVEKQSYYNNKDMLAIIERRKKGSYGNASLNGQPI